MIQSFPSLFWFDIFSFSNEMDEYLSKYIEKNEATIELSEIHSHIFDEILLDLWDNMESLFSIYKRSKPDLSGQLSDPSNSIKHII